MNNEANKLTDYNYNDIYFFVFEKYYNQICIIDEYN